MTTILARTKEWCAKHLILTGLIAFCALFVLVSACVWGLASIPHCTTLSSGDTICSRYINPFHREIWRE